MSFPTFVLRLPEWVELLIGDRERVYTTAEERMRLAIQLAQRNVEENTGGPFGAVIFDMNTNKLIAPGINMVVPSNCAILHAEMVAITMAQQLLGSFDLGAAGMPACELVSSTEPCAMCMGAVPWSGVEQLICGARDEDAREVGFDEGPKLDNWVQSLQVRGIKVIRDVCRQEAAAVLRHYVANEGLIYNGRGG